MVTILDAIAVLDLSGGAVGLTNTIHRLEDLSMKPLQAERPGADRLGSHFQVDL